MPAIEAELADLRRKQEQPDFFKDMQAVQAAGKRVKALETKRAEFLAADKAQRDTSELLELAIAEGEDG
ncbi:MAG: hypothetical protein LBM78_03360, partial [Clostridiales bacterium]|nr:hypothetical protein [Clostridiales bacterium]